MSKPKTPAADQIEVWPIDRVKPNPLNSKQHSDAQVDQLVAAFEEFGQTFPVLVDEKGMLVAGEGRWLAAKKREQGTIKVLVARGWSEAKKRAYLIMDNKLAENSTWDRQRLASEVANLSLVGFDVSLLGFDSGQIKAMIANAAKVQGDPDDAPPAPPIPVSQLGDLWICGSHRVLCGDSTDAESVRALLAGATPQLMVTDPPYGVNYDPEWRVKARVAKGGAMGKVKNDDRADWREAWALFPGVVAYVWHGGLHGAAVQDSLAAAKFVLRAQIIWVKSSLVMSRGAYHWQHEPAMYVTKQDSFDDHWRFAEDHAAAAYAVKIGETAGWEGGRKQSTVWEIPLVRNDTGHSTQKPVECMRRPIVNNSKGGDLVYDPFLGSGTTLIAAQMEGRICLGLELDPVYVDVIVQRWANFTGGVPVLQASGKTFAEVKAERDGKKAKAPRTPKASAGAARANGGRARAGART